MSKSTTLYERIWYLPTCLVSKEGLISLLGHVYCVKRSEKGNILLSNKLNVWEFDSEAAMAEFIRKHRAVELPVEADGKPCFVPPRVLNKVRKLRVAV